MPFEVVAEHAQEDVGAHPLGQPVVDRADMEVDGLDRADGPLDQAEGFVAPDRGGVVERGGGQAGAHDVEPVEGGLGGDLGASAGEGEAGVGDGEGEVLGHLAPVDHGADGQADFGLAAQRRALAPDGGGDGGKVALGGA